MKSYFFLLSALCCLFLPGCGPPYETDPEQIFSGSQPSFFSVKLDDRTIHYAAAGPENGQVVLFIHGTPGSWQAFGGYLGDPGLASTVRMLALDRPGFGKSDPGDLELSFGGQASLFSSILAPYLEDSRVILVGHSLGAPVAARMAMDYPDAFAALLLVAPSLDPKLENPRWYNRLADYPLVSWMVPRQLALANREVMALHGQLQEMMPLWDSVHIPVVVIQGMEDKLVDPANADFAEKMVGGDNLKVVRVEDEGHFILWDDKELIKAELLLLLEQITRAAPVRP